MRLWHQYLIPYLPRQQLLGAHRECCALRGAGWGRKHATVDYVFTYPPDYLVAYHYIVMAEMEKRGYHPDPIWKNTFWRGSTLGYHDCWALGPTIQDLLMISDAEGCPLYREHNDEYLQECLDNLKSKGINIELKGRE